MELRVRALDTSDLDEVVTLLALPGCAAGTLGVPLDSPDRRRRQLAETPEGAYRLVAEQLEGEQAKLVGLAGVTRRWGRRAHTATVWLLVHDDHVGRGVGTALMRAVVELADDWLRLDRLDLEVYTDNAPAIRLYESLGFEREGTLRRYAVRGGRFVDAYAMGRLRPDATG